MEGDELEVQRENGTIPLKDYLLKKREIKAILDYYDNWLKNTPFENW